MDKSQVKTLLDLVKTAADDYGDLVFVKEKAGKDVSEKTFVNFRDDVFRVVNHIASISDRKVHAAVIGPTSYAYLVSFFGIVSGGNVIVPLDAQLPCPDLCDHLQRADVSVFFYDSKYKPMLETIKAECPEIKHYICLQQDEDNISTEKIMAEGTPAENLPELNSSDLASIVYTSGTTGKSKGVMLTHGNYIDNTFCRDGEAAKGDSLLSVLPIHHIYCFTCDILLSLRYGTTVCVNDSMMRIALNLKLFQPSVILLVPMIAETILKQIKAACASKPEVPPQMIAQAVFGGKLRGIYSGGAYLAPEVMEEYKKLGIPMAQGYGMTEVSPRISSSLLTEENYGDVGVIVNGCQVRIEDGEIVVKSPSVMQGYYKNPEATAEVLTEDGWLHTGDLGYVDKNRVFITGRKKNLIILSNGENVSPEELENKFAGKDIIGDVLVYAEEGVITAEIFPNADYCKDMDKTAVAQALNELIKEINTTVTSAKTIRRIRLRDVEFDKTTSKKIRRQQSVKGDII
ncbi:MAG: AMP-binding protein [Oscillospiraceae bacterium]|nr:AMP-binding protein [Oscillospiraceae bacterium]